MGLIQKYGPAPRRPWLTVDGQFIDAHELRAEDVEIDLTGEEATIARTGRRVSEPLEDHWPTWAGL